MALMIIPTCTPDPAPAQPRCDLLQVDGCVAMGCSYMCWGADTAAWESCPDDLLSKASWRV